MCGEDFVGDLPINGRMGLRVVHNFGLGKIFCDGHLLWNLCVSFRDNASHLALIL